MHLGNNPEWSTHDMMWYGATEAIIEPAIVASSVQRKGKPVQKTDERGKIPQS
jgi:hypothetical protein